MPHPVPPQAATRVRPPGAPPPGAGALFFLPRAAAAPPERTAVTDLPRRLETGAQTYRRLAAAERGLARGLFGATALAAIAFCPGLGNAALDRGDALLAAAILASGIAMGSLGAWLRRGRGIQEHVES